MGNKLKHVFGHFVNVRSPAELGRGRNKYVSEEAHRCQAPTQDTGFSSSWVPGVLCFKGTPLTPTRKGQDKEEVVSWEEQLPPSLRLVG